jgi:ABC-type Fe3+/spermidine/putrescine transport system ATPase subunit
VADPAIELRDVDIDYGAGPVVRSVSLAIPDHEVHVLLGESGSGKTTILRAIAGFETVSAGEIALFGQVVDRGGERRAYQPPERRGVGVVFQDYALFPHLDVAGNVGFGMRPRSAGKVAALLEQVGLGGLGARSVAELSGGQQQRVALARALAQKPRVILLDEPFSNLNRELRDELRERTAELIRAERITAIFVTHDRHEAFALADRISVIGEGRVLQTGSCQDIYELPASEVVARSVGDVNVLDAEIERDERGERAGRCALGRLAVRGTVGPAPERAGGQAGEGAGGQAGNQVQERAGDPGRASGRLLIRPAQIALEPAAGQARGQAMGEQALARVAQVIYFGPVDEIRLVLDTGVRLLAHGPPGRVCAGDEVLVSVRGPAVWVP